MKRAAILSVVLLLSCAPPVVAVAARVPYPALNLALAFTHHAAGTSLTSVGGQSVDDLQVAVRLEL